MKKINIFFLLILVVAENQAFSKVYLLKDSFQTFFLEKTAV